MRQDSWVPDSDDDDDDDDDNCLTSGGSRALAHGPERAQRGQRTGWAVPAYLNLSTFLRLRLTRDVSCLSFASANWLHDVVHSAMWRGFRTIIEGWIWIA